MFGFFSEESVQFSGSGPLPWGSEGNFIGSSPLAAQTSTPWTPGHENAVKREMSGVQGRGALKGSGRAAVRDVKNPRRLLRD